MKQNLTFFFPECISLTLSVLCIFFTVVPEGSLGGSVPSSDAIGVNPEYTQSSEPLELSCHEANGDVSVSRTEVSSSVKFLTRSQKRDHPPRGIGDFSNHDGGIGNGADLVSPRITPTYLPWLALHSKFFQE